MNRLPRRRAHKAPCSLLLLGWLGAPTAGAFEQLEPLTVTALPLAGEGGTLADPVEVLSGAELAQRRRASLGETLARQPGVSASDFGQGASRPIIRGLGGARLRMLQDGVGSMDASSLSADHAVAIEPFEAEQIEILRGPATLLYGSGAIGGVVNVVTGRIPDRVPEKFGAQLDLRLDSVDEGGTGRYAFEGGAGQFAARVSGVVRRAGNYSPGGTSVEIPTSDVQTGQFGGGLSWVGEQGLLGLGLSSLRSDYGIPGEGARIELEQMRQDLEGRLDEPLPGIEQARVRLGRNDYRHREIEPDGEVGTTFDNREVEGRLELLHGPLGPWRGLAGVQVQSRAFSALGEEAYVPAVDQHSVGLFVLEERAFGELRLEAGARLEHAWNDPGQAGPAVDHTVYGLSAGLSLPLAPGWTVGANLGRAQRAPAIEELYSDGPHLATGAFEIGNPALGEETANSLDLGLRRDGPGWNLALNLYASLYQDFIYQQERDADGDGAPDRVNEEGEAPAPGEDTLLLLDTVQEEAWFHGLEFEAGAELLRGPAGLLEGRLMLDYVRGRLTDGTNLPRITPLRVGGALAWRQGPWSASLSALRVTAQGENAPLETQTDGYTLLDLALERTLGSSSGLAVLTLRAENLLDEEARRHESFIKDSAPLPGRNFGLDLRLSF